MNALTLAFPISLLAAEGESGYTAIITALQAALSTSGLTAILTAGLTASLAFVIFWFGVRKVMRIFMAGFRKGRASA